MSILIAVAALSLQVGQLPGATSATQTPPNTQTAATAPGTQDNPELVERVCRMEPVTGSRFPVRVCRSVRGQRADRQESQDMLRKMQGLSELLPSSASPKVGGF